uniref:Uncharacterized protein n=1 Tax=Opuntia streptacantha TaxID=393608 RepID=A0A7C9EEU5_OPUST
MQLQPHNQIASGLVPDLNLRSILPIYLQLSFWVFFFFFFFWWPGGGGYIHIISVISLWQALIKINPYLIMMNMITITTKYDHKFQTMLLSSSSTAFLLFLQVDIYLPLPKRGAKSYSFTLFFLPEPSRALHLRSTCKTSFIDGLWEGKVLVHINPILNTLLISSK